ncbi:hypothetical protein D9M71_582430 [compost metagenome]
MPQLQENSSAFCVDGIGDLAPAINLRLRVDTGRILVALSLLRDLRGFGDQQACRGSLAVIGCSELARDEAFPRTVTRQRSHHDSVGKCQRAERVRLK